MARKSPKNKKIAPIEASDANDNMQCNNITIASEIITSSNNQLSPEKQALRAKRIANLTPIKKGQVLNPEGNNGWTAGKGEMMRIALSAQAKAMKVLVKQLDSPDERIAQQASRELLDRAFGKAVSPVANVDSKGEDVPPPPPMVVIGVKSN